MAEQNPLTTYESWDDPLKQTGAQMDPEQYMYYAKVPAMGKRWRFNWCCWKLKENTL